MSPNIHTASPADAVEAAFSRIQQECMVDVPILNPALAVEAIDFQRWQGHWLGMVVTPWCMSLLLVPGSTDNWVSAGENNRRFVRFPAGDFAFLGGHETELGEYQSCSLFSPMGKFSTQSEATMTARASLVGLLTVPQPPQAVNKKDRAAGQTPVSRRNFFAFRKQ
ncbi:[NiFe]-hydrogenase assembly chaperone HybE [Rhodoferax ferrireducens]|uniref:[NiFe]-hydrogenase assembly chaperone HybE n=1 Tax=Rhodoferax ferrireducens TaxID=192843 RepID=UPI00298DB278|nr:[NiFe]-hydrogenase assembly chaperone HybE [Rhodoferax ferrireducens]WPC66832.1 [NiFe]-hydrogenase assembly chaperone HybE [Rhodoferax ferrireducens]